MSVLDRAALKAKNLVNIKATGNRETTATLVQALLDDYADSCLNKTTDAALLLSLADYDTGKSYVLGEGCFYDGQVYRANKATTGAWKPGDWNGTWPISTGGMIGAETNQHVYGGGGGDEDWGVTEVVSNVFVQPGQILRVKAFGTLAANGNNKQAKIQVGGNDSFVWASTKSGGSWWLEADLAVQLSDFKAYGRHSDGYIDIRTVAQNPLANFQVKMVLNSPANGDIVVEGFTVEKIGTLT